MNLLDEFMKQNKNGLTEQLAGWRNYRSAGHYNSWNNYKPENNAWKGSDELQIIAFLLERLFKKSDYLILSTTILSEFADYKNNSMSFKFNQIIHLLAVADLIDKLREQTTLNKYEEYCDESDEDFNQSDQLANYLEDNDFYVLLVKSCLPGPCLIYLNAVMNSLEENLEKICKIGNLIIDFSSKKELFGSLGSIVLKMAIQKYNMLTTDELKANKNFNEYIVEKSKQYKEQADSLSLEKITKNLTFLDRCILEGLKINFPSLRNELSDIFSELSKTPNNKELHSSTLINGGFFQPENKLLPQKNKLIEILDYFLSLDKVKKLISQSSEEDKQMFVNYMIDMVNNRETDNQTSKEQLDVKSCT